MHMQPKCVSQLSPCPYLVKHSPQALYLLGNTERSLLGVHRFLPTDHVLHNLLHLADLLCRHCTLEVGWGWGWGETVVTREHVVCASNGCNCARGGCLRSGKWWSDWQTYLGCEVKSESVWSHQGASLVCLAEDLAEGKVQGVGACVVAHD